VNILTAISVRSGGSSALSKLAANCYDLLLHRERQDSRSEFAEQQELAIFGRFAGFGWYLGLEQTPRSRSSHAKLRQK